MILTFWLKHMWLIRSRLFEVFLRFSCGLIILHNVIHLLQQGILLKVAETIKSWILAQSNKNDDLLHKLVSVHFTFWSLFRAPVSFPMRKSMIPNLFCYWFGQWLILIRNSGLFSKRRLSASWSVKKGYIT